MHILTGNLISDLPTNRVNGLSAQVWRSCSETGPIIHLGSKVGRDETLIEYTHFFLQKEPFSILGVKTTKLEDSKNIAYGPCS